MPHGVCLTTQISEKAWFKDLYRYRHLIHFGLSNAEGGFKISWEIEFQQ